MGARDHYEISSRVRHLARLHQPVEFSSGDEAEAHRFLFQSRSASVSGLGPVVNFTDCAFSSLAFAARFGVRQPM